MRWEFHGKLKEVPAITEWVSTHPVIPPPAHIYLMLLTTRGRKRWHVVHLLTDEEFTTMPQQHWESVGLDSHPASIQGLWIHATNSEVKP